MRGIAYLTLAAALALGSLPGCTTPKNGTEFRVYDLGEMYGGTLDDEFIMRLRLE